MGKQECPNCCHARRYGMGTNHNCHKISCIRFWVRLSKMSHCWLNYKIFTESCRLPGNGIKNWASSTCLDDLKTHLSFSPSLDDEYFLQYQKDVTTNSYQLEWLQQINAVSETSESGGRLNIYRKIKKDLTTESYVANVRSVCVRRVLAGLWTGCLPLAVKTGRYVGSPSASRCVGFVTVGRWRIKSTSLLLALLLKIWGFSYLTTVTP